MAPKIAKGTNIANTYKLCSYLDCLITIDYRTIVAEDGQQYLLKTQVYKNSNAPSEVTQPRLS